MYPAKASNSGIYECWENGRPQLKNKITVKVKQVINWSTYKSVHYVEENTIDFEIDASSIVGNGGQLIFTWWVQELLNRNNSKNNCMST